MSYGNAKWDPAYNKIDRDDFFASREWLELRALIIRRDGQRCQNCGAWDRLQVDHIVPLSVDWSRRKDPSNLQTLCHDCNIGKGRQTYRCEPPKNWRPGPPDGATEVILTRRLLDSLRTNGAFTAKTLAAFGLTLGHLKKGWIENLIGKSIPRKTWDDAVAGVGVYASEWKKEKKVGPWNMTKQQRREAKRERRRLKKLQAQKRATEKAVVAASGNPF